MHIHISLPLLFPDAGLPGPDEAFVVDLVVVGAGRYIEIIVFVAARTGADNMLLL